MGFLPNGELRTDNPQAPLDYDYYLVKNYQNTLHTYYLPHYTWSYLESSGILFFRWLERDQKVFEVGSSLDVWSFSSLSISGKNYNNEAVQMYGNPY